MKKNKEKTNKFSINKGELAIKLMAGILALLMVSSICLTLVYYIYSYFAA